MPGLLSEPRIRPYRDACEGDLDQAIRLYTWNVEVSSAFWGCVHAVEVGLRNAMNDRLSARFGRPDWWEASDVRLHSVHRGQLASARKLANETAREAKRAAVSDDLVASLSFGFWAGLLASGNACQYETQFWQPALRQAFPGFGGHRSVLHRDADALRLFRNRIAHHEPIFSRHLAADYAAILRVAGYLSDDLRDYIDSHSRVVETLARRARAVAKGYATRF